MVEISIIMPLYNASRYLEEALQSVLKQTFSEFELICINDASTDNTLDILYSFAKADNRIRILINDERMGAAYSRNRGITEARGSYIIFLDGDDIFDEDLLKLSYLEMERTDADIVMYEVKIVPTEQIYEKRFVERSQYFLERYCKNTFSPCQCDPLEFLSWNHATWSKIYRKSFICSNKIEFQSLPCSNDVYFGYMAFMLADRMIMLSDRRVMVYVRDHAETTRISNDRDPMCGYLAMKKLAEELEERGMFEKLFQHYYCVLYNRLIKALLATKNQEKAESFYNFLRNEGVKKLTILCESNNLELNPYILDLLRKFECLDFQSGWFENINILNIYLWVKGRNVVELIQNAHECESKIALWGAGMNGRVFLDFLADNNTRVDAVIDSDENKWGKIISGYKIKRPDEIIEDVQIVITTSNNIYRGISKKLDEKDIGVIDIQCMLGMYT